MWGPKQVDAGRSGEGAPSPAQLWSWRASKAVDFSPILSDKETSIVRCLKGWRCFVGTEADNQRGKLPLPSAWGYGSSRDLGWIGVGILFWIAQRRVKSRGEGEKGDNKAEERGKGREGADEGFQE
ncbi:hypothetical protein CRG98_034622 [Punica granatum]|uniref:Uncharacterized protein n=1 Tax=Punica granatum TaxID=22663 RepID=A0A2I0IMR0_PUNGR|nr:hypothetical protein CRG98_034622 [Punica granatum]